MSEKHMTAPPSEHFGLPFSPPIADNQQSWPLSPVVLQYVKLRQRLAEKSSSNQPTVEVNEMVGVWAFAYETLRNSVEYREETVLLRGAIRRILKRRLSPIWNYESTASALVRELIWARYLKNESVPQAKVEEIEELLAKYSVLRQAMVGQKQAEEWQNWILGIAACDIEQVLISRQSSYALAEVMLQWLRANVVIEGIPADQVEIQLYLAVHRSLLKSDRNLLTYHLFLINTPEWAEADQETSLKVAAKLARLRQTIDEQLNFDGSQDITRAVKKLCPPFIALDDVVGANPGQAEEALSSSDSLKKKIEAACQDRYSQMQTRIRTAILRSMIYIFVTKVGLALLLELPFDRYFYGQVHWLQLAFNVAFPPIFMALLGLSIRTPGSKNTEAIVARSKAIVQGQSRQEIIQVNKPRSTVGSVSWWAFVMVSLLTFIGVSSLLWQFGFTILGIGLFIFFFGVVVFFTYRVRQIAREMSVIRDKENFIESAVTIITLPFLALGYRLSTEFSKLNITTFVLDVLLEAPFKFILDMAERWFSFVRDKRDEVIDRHDY